jgi:hypothetical protein
MTILPGVGELFVGAHLRIVDDCDVVSYNQRSREQGEQMELDVLGVQSENGEQTVIACEVVTHLDGLHYVGTPSGNRWTDYGGKDYQFTLEQLSKKFHSDHAYVSDVFTDADVYKFQLWSPAVPKGYLTDGLEELQRGFEDEFDAGLTLVINEEYTSRINHVRSVAADTRKDYGEVGFRVFQILENLR